MDVIADKEGTALRKHRQLDIALRCDSNHRILTTGLEKYRFRHQALPEINLADIDTGMDVFGKKMLAPILISPMVGGTPLAEQLNHRLAKSAQKLGLAMGLGSERCILEQPSRAASYQVRSSAPDILLLANLGAVQLNNGFGLDECRRAVEMVGADGLVLHINPLQEALQDGGNTNFAGLLAKIGAVCQGLDFPVIAKEVGWGIAEDTARRLVSAGVSGIDVAGAGGTSWAEVERQCTANPTFNAVAASFHEWGIPTAESIAATARGAPKTVIIASGGIRSGLEAAKAMALGADLVGIGLPLLQAANVSPDALNQALDEIIYGLRLAMFGIGARNLSELKHTDRLERVA